MKTQQPETIPTWLGLSLVGCFLAAAVIFIGVKSHTPYVPQPGGIIDLRGDAFMRLRLPVVPVQEMTIYEDSQAILTTFPRYTYPTRRITLTPDEQRALAVLHTAWCQQIPPYRPLTTGELFYDLGVQGNRILK